MLNKKGAIEAEKVVTFIIVLLVIVVVILIMIKPDILNWMRNLPQYTYNDTDKLIDNFTEDQLAGMGCSKLVGQIGPLTGSYGFREQWITIGGISSNLYWNEADNQIFFRASSFNNIAIGKIEEDKKVVIYPSFLKESEEYLKYKSDDSISGIPNLEKLNLLHNSVLFGGYFCKTEEQADIFKQAKLCVETCSIYNGECKSRGINGEISYGKMDCEDKECYVKEKDEKLSDGDFSIEGFKFYKDQNGKAVENLMDNNQLNVKAGENQKFIFSASYSKSDSFPYSKNFCYIIRTDKFILRQDSYGEGDKFNILVNSPEEFFDKMGAKSKGSNRFNMLDFIVSDEKVFELVAWAPWDNKKVFKRINLITENPLNSYSDGKVINDKDFKKILISAKINEIFYINLEEPIVYDYMTTGQKIQNIFSESSSKIISISKFRVKKTGDNEVLINGYYTSPGDEKTDWYEMDCYGGLGNSMYIDNIESSLKETVVKKCKM